MTAVRTRTSTSLGHNVKLSDLFEADKHEALKGEILKHMNHRYQEVHPDLPRHGNYHFHSASDHLADHAYDHFNKHPDYSRKHHNLHTLAKKVVSRYSDNDTAESKKNDKKRERAWAQKAKPVKAKPATPNYKIKRVLTRPGGPYILRKVYKEEVEQIDELRAKSSIHDLIKHYTQKHTELNKAADHKRTGEDKPSRSHDFLGGPVHPGYYQAKNRADAAGAKLNRAKDVRARLRETSCDEGKKKKKIQKKLFSWITTPKKSGGD
jgi:hypothetical protein